MSATKRCINSVAFVARCISGQATGGAVACCMPRCTGGWGRSPHPVHATRNAGACGCCICNGIKCNAGGAANDRPDRFPPGFCIEHDGQTYIPANKTAGRVARAAVQLMEHYPDCFNFQRRPRWRWVGRALGWKPDGRLRGGGSKLTADGVPGTALGSFAGFFHAVGILEDLTHDVRIDSLRYPRATRVKSMTWCRILPDARAIALSFGRNWRVRAWLIAALTVCNHVPKGLRSASRVRHNRANARCGRRVRWQAWRRRSQCTWAGLTQIVAGKRVLSATIR
jgi:hypothetical protein